MYDISNNQLYLLYFCQRWGKSCEQMCKPHWWLNWNYGYETLYSNDVNQYYYVKQIINHIVSKVGKWYMFLYIYLSSLALRIYFIKFISLSFCDFVTTVHRPAVVVGSGANLKILFCYYCCWNTYKTEHAKVTPKILQLKIFQHKKQCISCFMTKVAMPHWGTSHQWSGFSWI